MLEDFITENDELGYDCEDIHVYPVCEEEVP
jgi:hypothetical protein